MARTVQLTFDAHDPGRLVALGATHVGDHGEHGSTWATLSDPEGNDGIS